MSISSIAATTAASTTATTAAPPPAAPPQPQPQPPSTQDPATRVTLSTLSEQAGIVATLDPGAGTLQTYDATGLLKAVEQAGMAGTDTSAGSSTSVAAAVPGDWGTILKSNPALTSVAVEDAVAQGIVNTINVYA
jgi:hypothetical protein